MISLDYDSAATLRELLSVLLDSDDSFDYAGCINTTVDNLEDIENELESQLIDIRAGLYKE